MKKKMIIASLFVIFVFMLILGIKYFRINAPFTSIAGENWKSVTIYYNHEIEINLTTPEELQEIYLIFEKMKVSTAGFPPKTSGVQEEVEIDGKSITTMGNHILYGPFRYEVSGNDDYEEDIRALAKKYARERNLIP